MKTQHKYFTLSGNKKRQFRIAKGRYENGNLALEMIVNEEGYEELWTVLSVNPSLKDPPGLVWIKTWSENEDIYLAMIKEGYLAPSEIRIPCGFAEAAACSITEKLSPYITTERHQ